MGLVNSIFNLKMLLLLYRVALSLGHLHRQCLGDYGLPKSNAILLRGGEGWHKPSTEVYGFRDCDLICDLSTRVIRHVGPVNILRMKGLANV